MRRTLVVISATLLIFGISHATDTTKFGVDSYVPEKFQDLQWRLNGSSQFLGTGRDDVSTSGVSENEGTERSGYLSSQLAYRWYTLQQFFNFSLGLSGELDYSHHKGSSAETIGNLRRIRYSQSSLHRFYLRGNPRIELGRYVSGNFFLGLSGAGAFERYEYRSHGYSHWEEYDGGELIEWLHRNSRNQRVDSRVQLSGGWMVGWGRVYSGAYAVTIEEIVRSLVRAGLLLREPSRAEYLALCDTIYSYRKRHYFDEREQRISAIKSIADQLSRMGVVDESVLPVLLIQDVWTFYPQTDRKFGWRAYGGPVAIWDWSRHSTYSSEYSYPYHSNESSDGAWGFRASAEYYRPLSLRLQLDATADLFVVSEDWRFRNTAKHYEGYRLASDVNYFFDSRTGAIMHVARVQNATPLDNLPEGRPRVYVQYETFAPYEGQTFRATELSCQLKHRISPPTTVGLTFQHYWTTLDNDNSISKVSQSGYTLSLNVAHWLY